jgi:shikimate kinase
MEALILLGPNGVGKSTIGRALAGTGRFQFIDIEAFFVEAYGSLEAYRANRQLAYAQLEAFLRNAIAESTLPVVFEEVALNESARAMLSALRHDHDIVSVELRAARDVCLQRASQRATTNRFPKSEQSIQAVWDRFVSDTPSTNAIARIIYTDQEDVPSIVATLLSLLPSE